MHGNHSVHVSIKFILLTTATWEVPQRIVLLGSAHAPPNRVLSVNVAETIDGFSNAVSSLQETVPFCVLQAKSRTAGQKSSSATSISKSSIRKTFTVPSST